MANPLDIKGMMSSAFKRLAAKYSVEPKDIAVKIFIHPVLRILSYELYVKWSSVKIADRFVGAPNEGLMSFNKDILGVKMDFYQREALLNQFLPQAIDKFVKETSTPERQTSPFDIFVLVSTTDNVDCEPSLFLYCCNVEVRQLTPEKDL